MVNCPGISWGVDAHVNLARSSKGFLALYYDDSQSRPDIIRIYKPRNYTEYSSMMKDLTNYNYNTCALCPMVRAALDW